MRRIELFFSLTASFARFFRTLFWAVVVTHLVGSLWHFIALQEGIESSWVADADLLDAGVPERYTAALYWAFATLTSVGYGDIKAVTSPGASMAALLHLLSCHHLCALVREDRDGILRCRDDFRAPVGGSHGWKHHVHCRLVGPSKCAQKRPQE